MCFELGSNVKNKLKRRGRGGGVEGEWRGVEGEERRRERGEGRGGGSAIHEGE